MKTAKRIALALLALVPLVAIAASLSSVQYDASTRVIQPTNAIFNGARVTAGSIVSSSVTLTNGRGGFGTTTPGSMVDVTNAPGTTTQLAHIGTNVGVNITAAGTMGVGAASPTNILEIAAPSGAAIMRLANPDNLSGTNWSGVLLNAIEFWNNDASLPGSSAEVRVIGSPDCINGFPAGDYTILTRQTNFALTEKVRITDSGKVGIGTPRPATSLDVTGGVACASINASNSITTPSLSTGNLYANTLGLTNKVGPAVVALGYQDLTNAVLRKNIYADASCMISNSTGGATFSTEETSSPTNRMSDSYIFDGAVTNLVQFRLVMPENWDLSTIKVKLWTQGTNNIATTTNVWAISAAAIKPSSVITNINWGTELNITNAVSSAGGQALLTPATPALTVGNSPASGGNLVWFRIRRLPGHPDDNNGGQHKLLGAWIQYGETMSEVASW